MRKTLPTGMLGDSDQARLTVVRNWVLEQHVTEIEMTERQFWIFAQLQPAAEKPWTTFMGRPLRVPEMPNNAQIFLGISDKTSPGAI
jgi:hypothetical protein